MSTKIIMPPGDQGGVLLAFPAKIWLPRQEQQQADGQDIHQVMETWSRTYLVQNHGSLSLVLVFRDEISAVLLQKVLDVPNQQVTANGTLVIPAEVMIKHHPILGQTFVHLKNPNDEVYRKIRATYPKCQIIWQVGENQTTRRVDLLGASIAHNLRVI